MKLFVTLGVILVTLSIVTSAQEYTEEEKKRILKHREECIAETTVNPEFIDRADKGDFVDDDKLKCFTKCFYQKAGFVNEKGELEIETIKAKIPAAVDIEKALEVINKCQQKGKDSCETVYLIHKCYFNHTQQQQVEKKDGEKGAEKGKEQSEVTGSKKE